MTLKFKPGDIVVVNNRRSSYDKMKGQVTQTYTSVEEGNKYKVLIKEMTHRWMLEMNIMIFDDLPDDGRKDKWI